MAKQLIGKAPLSLVRMAGGTVEYVYGGRPVPAGVDEADAARLLEEGFLLEIGEPEAPARRSSRGSARPKAVSEGSPGTATAVPPIPPAAEVPEDVDGEELGDGPPPKAASKDAWVDYAVAQRAEGISEDEARSVADSLTKAELIERFGA